MSIHFQGYNIYTHCCPNKILNYFATQALCRIEFYDIDEHTIGNYFITNFRKHESCFF